MKTIEKLAKEYKKTSDKVYSDRKSSKKVWVGHRLSKNYQGAINSKDKLTLDELSASISEATGTNVDEVANIIFSQYTAPYIAGLKDCTKVGNYTLHPTPVSFDIYTILETHINPKSNKKTFFLSFEEAEFVCRYWESISYGYTEVKKQQPWKCVKVNDIQ